MRLDPPAPRRRPESIVPMINVVFLLLIFFLMSAQIAPPDPVEVTPPAAPRDAAIGAGVTLFVGADGAVAFRDLEGPAAIGAAVAAAGDGDAFHLRADADVPAARVAALVARIVAAGRDGALTLVTTPP